MRKQKGFTLVELVVVVMILGILAAVAAPKLLNTSSTATDNGIKQSLAIIRDAIERYAAENGGELPPGGTSDAFKNSIAKYLRGEFPKLPLFGKNADVAITASAGPITVTATGECWHYNSGDGQFIVNNAGATNSDPGVNYNEL